MNLKNFFLIFLITSLTLLIWRHDKKMVVVRKNERIEKNREKTIITIGENSKPKSVHENVEEVSEFNKYQLLKKRFDFNQELFFKNIVQNQVKFQKIKKDIYQELFFQTSVHYATRDENFLKDRIEKIIFFEKLISIANNEQLHESTDDLISIFQQVQDNITEKDKQMLYDLTEMILPLVKRNPIELAVKLNQLKFSPLKNRLVNTFLAIEMAEKNISYEEAVRNFKRI